MARNRAGLEQALQEIPALREEFWRERPACPARPRRSTSRSSRRAAWPTSSSSANCSASTPSTREESCGCHFREEHQYPDGECKRDDGKFAHVAAWEYQGEGRAPLRNVEPLDYEIVKMSVRNYK